MPPKAPGPEAHQVAMNYLASSILHVSEAYLYMASYYYGDKEPPLFLSFSEDQVEVKKAHAGFFIEYLRDRRANICLSVIKRADIAVWHTAVEALNFAQELEQQLEEHIKQLRMLISRDGGRPLKCFVLKVVTLQPGNLNNLRRQIRYQEIIDRKA